jgi:ATP/maltotriose-dependent transcriptional regulator MalT
MALGEAADRITIVGDVDAEVRGRQVRAKVLARRGRHPEAEALAEEALRLAARTDYLDPHAFALLAVAEVHRLAGRNHDAASAVHEAVELFRRKGNVVAEARAASLLDERGE